MRKADITEHVGGVGQQRGEGGPSRTSGPGWMLLHNKPVEFHPAAAWLQHPPPPHGPL